MKSCILSCHSHMLTRNSQKLGGRIHTLLYMCHCHPMTCIVLALKVDRGIPIAGRYTFFMTILSCHRLLSCSKGKEKIIFFTCIEQCLVCIFQIHTTILLCLKLLTLYVKDNFYLMNCFSLAPNTGMPLCS